MGTKYWPQKPPKSWSFVLNQLHICWNTFALTDSVCVDSYPLSVSGGHWSEVIKESSELCHMGVHVLVITLHN